MASKTFSYDSTSRESTNTLIAKVFGVMFLGLLLTALISIGGGYLFNYALNNAINVGDNELEAQLVSGFLIVLIISSIGLLVMSIALPIRFMRGRHSILPSSIIYVTFMGLLMSSFVIIDGVDWQVFGISFAFTAFIFGLMSLLALLAKGSMRPLGLVISGLFSGIVILSIISLILHLTGNLTDSIVIDGVIALAFFAFIMFITMYDVYRIKRIAENGMMNNNNLVLYCAFILYTDFIHIFIRILNLVSRLKNR